MRNEIIVLLFYYYHNFNKIFHNYISSDQQLHILSALFLNWKVKS
jgi:hypothetical protein